MDFHDPVAAWSHLLMAAWSAVAAAVALRLAARHTPAQRAGLWAYAVSVVCLYTASGLFHSIRHPSRQSDSYQIAQLIDQTAIFGLIYGSNVPILIYVLRPRLRNALLLTMGGVALAGTLSLWFLPKPPHLMLVGIYLAMGVMGVIPIRYYFAALGWHGTRWIAALAFFYIGGGVIEALNWPNPAPGVVNYHEMMHFADILGTLAHYVLLLRVVTGRYFPVGPGAGKEFSVDSE